MFATTAAAWLESVPASLQRRPQQIPDGVCSFGDNDYLGLKSHPALIAAAQQAAAQYGVGAAASRMAGGTLACHVQLEEQIAHFKKTESALVFGCGYLANSTILPALTGLPHPRPPLILLDTLSHASLVKGILESRCLFRRFRHNNVTHLEDLLKKYAHSHAIFVVTESVFSMDGDIAPLAEILSLKQRYGFFLYLDEAHATGVLGEEGAGLASNFAGRVDLVLSTGGKALGSYGAFVAGSQTLIKVLIQRCGSVLFTTALPPMVTASLSAAISLIPSLNAERETLRRHRKFFDDVGSTPIIPHIVGDEEAALAASARLLDQGFYCPAIRPPTVPKGTARLRISLSARHTDDEVARLKALL